MNLGKLSSFHMTSLRKIQHIFWPRTYSNRDLLARCQQRGYGDHHHQKVTALDWVRATPSPELRIVDPSLSITEHDHAKLSSFHMISLSKNPTHFPAKNHLQSWPPSTVPARGYGDHHHQKVMALDWACAAQGCQLHHHSCNPLDPRGKAEAWLTKDNLVKNCGSGNEESRTWTAAGASSRGWPVTARGGGASLLPYTPAGMMGSDDDKTILLHEPQLGHHPEAGQWQTGVEELHCCPISQLA